MNATFRHFFAVGAVQNFDIWIFEWYPHFAQTYKRLSEVKNLLLLSHNRVACIPVQFVCAFRLDSTSRQAAFNKCVHTCCAFPSESYGTAIKKKATPSNRGAKFSKPL